MKKKKTTKKIDLISHSLKFRERERHTHTHTHEKYGWTRARAPVKADDPLHRIVRQGDRKRPTSETAYNFLCKAGARSFHLENCNLLRRCTARGYARIRARARCKRSQPAPGDRLDNYLVREASFSFLLGSQGCYPRVSRTLTSPFLSRCGNRGSWRATLFLPLLVGRLARNRDDDASRVCEMLWDNMYSLDSLE